MPLTVSHPPPQGDAKYLGDLFGETDESASAAFANQQTKGKIESNAGRKLDADGFLDTSELAGWTSLKVSSNLGASARLYELEPEVIAFVEKLRSGASVTFDETMAVIEAGFEEQQVPFAVGALASAKGENAGSAKILSLGRLASLTEAEVLACFGQYYVDVQGNPSGDDHGNIRGFMAGGWGCVDMPLGVSLMPKGSTFSYEDGYKAADATAMNTGTDGEWGADEDSWMP